MIVIIVLIPDSQLNPAKKSPKLAIYMLNDKLKTMIPKRVRAHEEINEIFRPQLSVIKGIRTYPNIAPAYKVILNKFKNSLF